MKNEEFNKLDHLIRTKRYSELQKDERLWIDEALGQNGYEELTSMVAGVAKERVRKTSSDVKIELIKAMKRKHRGALATWLGYKTPMYANVLTLLLFGVLLWVLLPAKEVIVEKPVTITVPVVDTVTIQLPPDTVLIERRVRVEVPVYLTRTEQPKEPKKEIRSKPFADEQALQDLLVSGR